MLSKAKHPAFSSYYEDEILRLRLRMTLQLNLLRVWETAQTNTVLHFDWTTRIWVPEVSDAGRKFVDLDGIRTRYFKKAVAEHPAEFNEMVRSFIQRNV